MDRTMRRLLDAVDMASYVIFNKENERLFVWNGSLTVNIYSTITGECVDCYTLDDKGREGYTTREVHDSIWNHINGDD
jgi:hypothetical protein